MDYLPAELFAAPVGDERADLQIEAVVDHFGSSGRYTPGGMFTIRGSGFGTFDDPPRGAGIYLCGSRRRPLPAYRYLAWRENEITGIWPVGIHLCDWLLLVTQRCDCSGQTRSTFAACTIPAAGDREASRALQCSSAGPRWPAACAEYHADRDGAEWGARTSAPMKAAILVP